MAEPFAKQGGEMVVALEARVVCRFGRGPSGMDHEQAGALVGRAAAVVEAYGSEKGIALLEHIPFAEVVNYQPYWALAGHLYKRMNRKEDALSAYSRAIGLCTDVSIRQFLNRQATEIEKRQ